MPNKIRSYAELREQLERLVPLGFLSEAVEPNDQQLEEVLSYLGEKPTEVERYVYLIRLCDRNERLVYKALMSERIIFLLSSDCRRRLHEIWLHLSSFESDAHVDSSLGPNTAAAA